MIRRLSSVAAVALLPALFLSQAGAQTASIAARPMAPHGQPSTAKGDWPMYFADPSGSRYSPQDQINASNFNKLEVAWHFKTDNLGGRPEFKLEGTPLEINGTVYTTAGSRRAVIALNAKTGEMKWMYSLDEGARAALAFPIGPMAMAMSAFFMSPPATAWWNWMRIPAVPSNPSAITAWWI
jgi:quinoprotein glucose dehydrogenase